MVDVILRSVPAISTARSLFLFFLLQQLNLLLWRFRITVRYCLGLNISMNGINSVHYKVVRNRWALKRAPTYFGLVD